MTFDAQATFANLAEKERVYGHHSAEGRAIRTLSRALNGWSVGNLSADDVIVLCDQAIEDWLKARLKLSQWSAKNLSELLKAAMDKNYLMPIEAERLRQIHQLRAQSDPATRSAAEVEAALADCIQIVEKHWS
jgi:aminoglycoside phosphotransferase